MNDVSSFTGEFSREQWQAATAVDRHVLVSAGAGTGKTRTVVGRILFLLGVELEPPEGAPKVHVGDALCSLKDIAAITFTNAAAADLKQKLRGALIAAGRADVAYEIDVSRIGTIHSFCLELLREFSLQAGTNPRDEIIDEATALTIRAEVVRDTILRVLETREVSNLDKLLQRFSVKAVRDILDGLLRDSDRLRRVAEHENIPVTERALLDIALLAVDSLDNRLVELELIDFDRVIVRARDLLSEHAQIRSILRRRIKTLIIDEFQDVDPVQKEIAYLLGDPESRRSDTTRLMLVGDAKQSIYRFRRADVAVWREVLRDFASKGWGAVCSTTKSFRCSRQILGLVDSTIGKALDSPVDSEGLKSYEVPFEPLTIGLPRQNDGPPVELILLPANETGKDRNAAERRRLEVLAAAERARALHEDGYEWGEMAVLLRSWSMARDYQVAFESIGASAYPLRTTGFYEQREILDIQLALEAVCDPADDRALTGFLRSPFVCVSDETLLRLRNTSTGPLFDSIGLDGARLGLSPLEAQRLSDGSSILKRFVTMRDRVPTHELLEDLLYDTGYLAHLSLMGADKDQAIANVLRLLRQARNASRLSTTRFLGFMNQCRTTASEVSEPIVPRKDAVTITTTHSAKGLEWKVVFWGGLGLGLNTRDSGKILVGRDTIALRDPGAERQPANYDELQELLSRESLAEEKRLWYVAATRAIERLVLCGISEARIGSDKKTQIADFILPGLQNVSARDGSRFSYENAAGDRFEGIVRVVGPEVLGDPDSPRSHPTVRSADSLPEIFEPVPVAAGRPRHSATEYLTFSTCPRRHWLKYTLGIREPSVIDNRGDRQIDAVSRGLIVHDVLERLREDAELDDLLDDAIRKRDENAPAVGTSRSEQCRDHLRAEIERVAGHSDYRAIADLPGARKELSFLYIAHEDEYYEGSIDLIAKDDDGLTLLDVKTPQCDWDAAAAKAARYAPQQYVYIAAAEEIGGMKVGRFAFQFSRASRQVCEEIDVEKRKRAARFVEETARRIESGECETAANEHECRFCCYADVGLCCGAPCGK